MTNQWHGGKGDKERKSTISVSEKDLRWELAFGKPSDERKQEILQVLGEMNK